MSTELKADLGVVRRRLNKVLSTAEGVNFTDFERESLTDSLRRVRGLMADLEKAIS